MIRILFLWIVTLMHVVVIFGQNDPEPIPVGGGPVAVQNPPPQQSGGDNLADIRNEFVGGVAAITDSAGRIIGWGAHSVKQGVQNVVRPIVDVGRHVVNKTIFIKDNLAQAGGQIVNSWGQSIQQTKNITGQLIENVGRK